MFQSTHPRRVWRQESTVEQQTSSFNPHTHEGCDTDRILPSLPWQCFNPHTHEGCDREYRSHNCCLQVSIHTPIQGVTRHRRTSNQSEMFQSTHPYRVWPIKDSLFCQILCFNPHTHTGCDYTSIIITDITACFNPHTHTGCDMHSGMYRVHSSLVSIHTPIQGVTIPIRLLYVPSQVSIHTPIQGVTGDGVDGEVNRQFQSTHPYRVWLFIF